MHQPYVSLLLLLAFVAANAALLIVLSHLAAPTRPTPLKQAPYESGMPPLGDAHERFSVKFYLIAMLFIVFDIETVFLIPWGAIYFGAGGSGLGTGEAGVNGGAAALAVPTAGPTMGFLLVEMLVFLVILFVGYIYVWRRGAFQWD